MSEEHVLVIPTDKFRGIQDFQGFTERDELRHIITSPLLQYIPRSQAEENLAYKQLIPYVIFYSIEYGLQGDELGILAYQRGKAGGEKRLEAKWSIGFGGHINDGDKTYTDGVLRELDEELQNARFDKQDIPIIGFVNDDTNPVGQVHLGIVHLVKLPLEMEMRPRDPAVETPHWFKYNELKGQNLESWSAFCLPWLSVIINEREL